MVTPQVLTSLIKVFIEICLWLGFLMMKVLPFDRLEMNGR